MENINIRIEGQHGSLTDLQWPDVPPFAVVTGVNGSGKSQLLEVIAQTYGALGGSPYGQQTLSKARSHIDGATFEVGEVFHSYGEWAQFSGFPATQEEFERALRSLQEDNVTVVRTLENSPGGIVYAPILHAIAAQGNIGVEAASQLPADEFVRHLTPGLFWAYAGGVGPPGTQNLALLFLAYMLFERDAKALGATEEVVRRRYGEPPWLLLNEILEISGLPFRVEEPEAIRPTALLSPNRVDLRLRDVERDGEEVPFDGLSSGEKVIMSTVLWQYSAQITDKHHKLLLLDEPDAHLHPSLTRRFLEVVQKVFVEERGVRVIMTTHSPSTVSLVPKESLFEMKRTGERIRPVESKDRVIATLTEGFVTVQDATRIVLVEGKDDPPFYGMVWDLLTRPDGISDPGPLQPFPALAFIHGKGVDTVQALLPQMRDRELQNFHGIIDNDFGNTPAEGVHALERHSIENYLFDPINVWLLLLLNGRAPAVRDVELGRGQVAFARNLPDDQLQRIADEVINIVEGVMTDLDTDDKLLEEVRFANGKRVRYPRWLLRRRGKDIVAKFQEAFNSTRRLKTEDLLANYEITNLVPQDLLDLMSTIQASGIPDVTREDDGAEVQEA